MKCRLSFFFSCVLQLTVFPWVVEFHAFVAQISAFVFFFTRAELGLRGAKLRQTHVFAFLTESSLCCIARFSAETNTTSKHASRDKF